MQNGHVESFNEQLRDECLNATVFTNLADARNKIEQWRRQYNAERPHSSLAYRTPDDFAKTCSELISGMGANPPARPSESVGGTAVLAVKSSLTLRSESCATGGSGGMATGR
jgi:putative transposase